MPTARVSAYFGKMDMGQGCSSPSARSWRKSSTFRSRASRVHGRHRHQRQSGRRVRLDRRSGRRQADAHGRGRSAARAGRDGGRQARRCRPSKLDGDGRRRHAADDAAKKVSYAELIGGQYFNVQLDWNGKYGNPLYAPARRSRKIRSEHKIVGQPIKREDIAPKVFAQEDFCTDIKVPGMVHGRMIRPPVAGAVPVKVDEASIKDIPTARWSGTRASSASSPTGNGTRSGGAAAQGRMVEYQRRRSRNQAALYDHIRKAPVRKRRSKARKPATSTRVQDRGA
jgi:nicotinate dehydrogenase subunit B